MHLYNLGLLGNII